MASTDLNTDTLGEVRFGSQADGRQEARQGQLRAIRRHLLRLLCSSSKHTSI